MSPPRPRAPRRPPVRAALAAVLLVAAAGTAAFAQGFFLTRLELHAASACGDLDGTPLAAPPRAPGAPPAAGERGAGCWAPRVYDRLVLIVVDAWRYDFAAWRGGGREGGSLSAGERGAALPAWANRMPRLRALLAARPSHAALVRFTADAPTVTAQRLKGLTTGSLPTFADIGAAFASPALSEDNIIQQLRAAADATDAAGGGGVGGARRAGAVLFAGDDTWAGLFPAAFHATRALPSFDVADLHTVDAGVRAALAPLLAAVGAGAGAGAGGVGGDRPPPPSLLVEANRTTWRVVVCHVLGLDHAGHRYHAAHAATAAKLVEVDDLLADTIRAVEAAVAAASETALVVALGDHGMTPDGNHGGATRDETDAALLAVGVGRPLLAPRLGKAARRRAPPDGDDVSTEPRFGGEGNAASADDAVDDDDDDGPADALSQVDLVPTLALALGVPIPHASLGAVARGWDWRGAAPPAGGGDAAGGAWGGGGGGGGRCAALAAAAADAHAAAVNAWQVRRYVTAYAAAAPSFAAAARVDALFAADDAAHEAYAAAVRALVAVAARGDEPTARRLLRGAGSGGSGAQRRAAVAGALAALCGERGDAAFDDGAPHARSLDAAAAGFARASARLRAFVAATAAAARARWTRFDAGAIAWGVACALLSGGMAVHAVHALAGHALEADVEEDAVGRAKKSDGDDVDGGGGGGGGGNRRASASADGEGDGGKGDGGVSTGRLGAGVGGDGEGGGVAIWEAPSLGACVAAGALVGTLAGAALSPASVAHAAGVAALAAAGALGGAGAGGLPSALAAAGAAALSAASSSSSFASVEPPSDAEAAWHAAAAACRPPPAATLALGAAGGYALWWWRRRPRWWRAHGSVPSRPTASRQMPAPAPALLPWRAIFTLASPTAVAGLALLVVRVWALFTDTWILREGALLSGLLVAAAGVGAARVAAAAPRGGPRAAAGARATAAAAASALALALLVVATTRGGPPPATGDAGGGGSRGGAFPLEADGYGSAPALACILPLVLGPAAVWAAGVAAAAAAGDALGEPPSPPPSPRSRALTTAGIAAATLAAGAVALHWRVAAAGGDGAAANARVAAAFAIVGAPPPHLSLPRAAFIFSAAGMALSAWGGGRDGGARDGGGGSARRAVVLAAVNAALSLPPLALVLGPWSPPVLLALLAAAAAATALLTLVVWADAAGARGGAGGRDSPAGAPPALAPLSSLPERLARGADALLAVTAGCLLPGHAFWATGHRPSFSSLVYESGFVGADAFSPPRAGALLALNTFGASHALVLPALASALPALLRAARAPAAHGGGGGARGGGGGESAAPPPPPPPAPLPPPPSPLAPAPAPPPAPVAALLLLPPTLTLAATIAFVAIERRHLQVWAVFAPKFVFEVAGLALSALAVAGAAPADAWR